MGKAFYLFLLCFIFVSASLCAEEGAQQVRRDLGPVGSIQVPETWALERHGDTTRIAVPARELRLLFYRVRGEETAKTVSQTALKMGFSGPVRPVSGTWLEEVGAQFGAFTHGTRPLTEGEVQGRGDREASATDSTRKAPPVPEMAQPARYCIVGVYERRGWLYVMEAQLPAGEANAMLVSELHRSWRLN